MQLTNQIKMLTSQPRLQSTLQLCGTQNNYQQKDEIFEGQHTLSIRIHI